MTNRADRDKLVSEYIELWASKNTLRDGRSWQNWSGSLAWRLTGSLGRPYASVRDAMNDSEIVSTDYRDAPVGAVHYFDAPYGQVAFDVRSGGEKILVSSLYLTEQVGDYLGYISMEDYLVLSRLKYLGFALTYGKDNDFEWITNHYAETMMKGWPTR